MTTTRTPAEERPVRIVRVLDRHPSTWLLLGGALLVGSQMRFGIGGLAWLAPLPFLRHTRVTVGWRARLALVAASLGGWSLATAKIFTAPLPLFFVVLFALPIGTALTLPYLLVPEIRRRLGEGAAVTAFGTLMVSAEWILHAALPFGTWGSAANTQLEQLALLQLASVTGLHGVSFLVYVVGASLESLLDAPSRRRAAVAATAIAAVLVAATFGEARLAASTARGRELVRVAAVGTDSTAGMGPVPTGADNAAVETSLLDRTRAAARSGASMVVWTEVATVVEPGDEKAFLARVAAVAREANVAVVAGYVVPLSTEPLRYRNRYALLTPDGAVDHVYDKRHPTPGEPVPASDAPVPVFTHPDLGRVSGALCYDYDFPRIGLEHARRDVDLVALPSSDWRGIDPIHTQMAVVRAIEGGHSVVRSTRYGLSAGIDPYGRVRGWLSHFDEGDRILIVSLPRRGTRTVYGLIGDWFPVTCLVFGSLAVLAARLRGSRCYAGRAWRTRSSPSAVARSSTPASASASTSTRS